MEQLNIIDLIEKNHSHGRKDHCKRVLEKHFVENTDYIVTVKESIFPQVEALGRKNVSTHSFV